MVAFYMPNMWAVLAFRWASVLFGGMSIAAGYSLSLEQVPKFRGSMMSMITAFIGIGGALGVVAGGVVLNFYNYQTLGLALGVIGIVSAFVAFFATKDPCRTEPLPDAPPDRVQ